MLGDICINSKLFNIPLFTLFCQTLTCKFGGFAQNSETNFWSIFFFLLLVGINIFCPEKKIIL